VTRPSAQKSAKDLIATVNRKNRQNSKSQESARRFAHHRASGKPNFALNHSQM